MIHRNYTIRFILHRRGDSSRQHLQMRVTPRGGKPVSFATGVSLTDAEWDPLLGRAKGRTGSSAEANTIIAQWSQVISRIFAQYETLNVTPTGEQLRQAFANATSLEENSTTQYSPHPSAQMTLMAAYTQFVLECKNECSWARATLRNMMSFRSMLTHFLPNTPLESIDTAWMSRFKEWLATDRKQLTTSVNSSLSKLGWFLRWARRKGLYHGTADKEYRPKLKGVSKYNRSVVFLTRDELQRVENLELDDINLIMTRDAFLFGCYTGMRSSDILKLTRADCHGDHITFMTSKTNDILTIPLSIKAKEMLDRHVGCTPTRGQRTAGVEHPALPVLTCMIMNKNLRIIMQAAGIDSPTRHTYYTGADRHDDIVPKYQLITTHAARHTFIVTAISLGIPVPVIMEWTGHCDYNAMRPYVAIANETSFNAMRRFDEI